MKGVKMFLYAPLGLLFFLWSLLAPVFSSEPHSLEMFAHGMQQARRDVNKACQESPHIFMRYFIGCKENYAKLTASAMVSTVVDMLVAEFNQEKMGVHRPLFHQESYVGVVQHKADEALKAQNLFCSKGFCQAYSAWIRSFFPCIQSWVFLKHKPQINEILLFLQCEGKSAQEASNKKLNLVKNDLYEAFKTFFHSMPPVDAQKSAQEIARDIRAYYYPHITLQGVKLVHAMYRDFYDFIVHIHVPFLAFQKQYISVDMGLLVYPQDTAESLNIQKLASFFIDALCTLEEAVDYEKQRHNAHICSLSEEEKRTLEAKKNELLVMAHMTHFEQYVFSPATAWVLFTNLMRFSGEKKALTSDALLSHDEDQKPDLSVLLKRGLILMDFLYPNLSIFHRGRLSFEDDQDERKIWLLLEKHPITEKNTDEEPPISEEAPWQEWVVWYKSYHRINQAIKVLSMMKLEKVLVEKK